MMKLKALALALALAAAVSAAFSHPANNVESATIEAMVWEILYETAGIPYDLATGTFTATSNDSNVQAMMNGVNWGALSGTPVTLLVDQLYSREHQDFLVLTPVPEPGAYALLLAGLASIGFVACRRTRAA